MAAQWAPRFGYCVVHCADDLHTRGTLMPTIKNTDKDVRAAKVRDRQIEYVIEGTEGLRLHIQPSGKRRWYFHYWQRQGEKRKHKALLLGHADMDASSRDQAAMSRAEACRRAARARVDLDSGRDPVGERHAEQRKQRAGEAFKTLDDLAEAWLKKAVRGKIRSAEQYEARYKRHVKPALGMRRPEEVERRDVIAFLDDLGTKLAKKGTGGGTEVNRVQHLIHAIYGWATSEDILKVDPAYRLKYRHREQPRQRALTPAEMKAIWHGLELERFSTAPQHQPISKELRDIYRLLILLGQRKMEVAGMRRDELDLESKPAIWTIPSQRTKNSVSHRVPLPPLALAIIRDALARVTSEYVFPCWQTGRPYSSVGVGDVSRLLREELKLGDDVRVHDFRRTMGTQMAALRISEGDRARVLNHVRGANTSTTAKVYDVYAYDDEKLKALSVWESKLRSIIGENVIPISDALSAS